MSTVNTQDSRTEKLKLPQILQKFDGEMTRELLLKPGKHGLGMTHDSLDADATLTAVCGYCSTGCGLRLHVKESLAVGLTPETSYPVNLGMACPKGWEALRVLESDDRAVAPLLRNEAGKLDQVDWHTALTEFCNRFKSIQSKHGADSVAFLSTGQIASEEMAFLGVLAKFGMGMVHGDGNTRQCMATSVVAYKESFGFDAPPYTYQDFEESDCLVFIGANPCIGHPIMWERVLRNKNTPEIIVIDPRRTETAMAATQHLALAPKSDLVLLYAITKCLIDNRYIDLEFIELHTNGFASLVQRVQPYSLEYAAQCTGLTKEQIAKTAEAIGTAKAASLWWTMGVNQSYEGVRTAQAIINIALITGNIGRPGTGANSITGQCNAMGSRLWSNTTNLFGHHDFKSELDRRKIAHVLGIPDERIPNENSWSYDQILDGIQQGTIKGLWVIATNPSHSWLDQSDCRKILEQLDFLVVQDMYRTTETAQQADLLLPAAGWGEKEGTFINSERRYGLHRRVRKAPGEALSDFNIFRAVSHYWGTGKYFDHWTKPEDVFQSMRAASEGQPCDITGIEGYEQLDRCGGIQWPWSSQQAQELNAQDPPQQRRLFEDGKFYTPSGRANLIVDSPQAMPEPPDKDFPFLMLSGRGTVSQWHTQTRTSKSPILRQLYPETPVVEINTKDARQLSILNGSTVSVESRRGSMQATAWVTPTVSPGQIFIPMHYEGTNRLTLQHFDPHSRQPSFKNCAVRVCASSS